MRRCQAFTLIEIAIAVFILLLLLLLAVPSVNGVLADRRLRRSLDGLNQLVQQAQQLSMSERRAYLMVWERGEIILRPEAFRKDEGEAPTAVLSVGKNETFTLTLPAALTKNSPAEWIFWSSGNCEPAIVSFKGEDGSWTAEYSALTARPELKRYAAR
jgi:type II secretory pathway pseudopilin PulG